MPPWQTEVDCAATVFRHANTHIETDEPRLCNASRAAFVHARDTLAHCCSLADFWHSHTPGMEREGG
eukprot:7393427-Lingulodinium_polyedra.AAC.1